MSKNIKNKVCNSRCHCIKRNIDAHRNNISKEKINDLNNSRSIHYTELGMTPFNIQYQDYILVEQKKLDDIKNKFLQINHKITPGYIIPYLVFNEDFEKSLERFFRVIKN
jgi:hypothetical protein